MRPAVIELFRRYPDKAPVIVGLNAPTAPLLLPIRLTEHATNKRKRLMTKQGGKCAYCDTPFSAKVVATLDHVLPKSKGGRNCLDNLVLACHRCNGLKGDLSTYEEAVERAMAYMQFAKILKSKGYLK